MCACVCVCRFQYCNYKLRALDSYNNVYGVGGMKHLRRELFVNSLREHTYKRGNMSYTHVTVCQVRGTRLSKLAPIISSIINARSREIAFKG